MDSRQCLPHSLSLCSVSAGLERSQPLWAIPSCLRKTWRVRFCQPAREAGRADFPGFLKPRDSAPKIRAGLCFQLGFWWRIYARGRRESRVFCKSFLWRRERSDTAPCGPNNGPSQLSFNFWGCEQSFSAPAPRELCGCARIPPLPSKGGCSLCHTKQRPERSHAFSLDSAAPFIDASACPTGGYDVNRLCQRLTAVDKVL